MLKIIKIVVLVMLPFLSMAQSKVYWTEATGNQINRSNLDGTSFEQYHTEPTFIPMGIAVDTLSKTIYWSNNWGQIRKGTIDVSGILNVKDVINELIDLPRAMMGLALDVAAGRIYWASNYDGSIKSADLLATNPTTTIQTLNKGLSDVRGVAIDKINGKLYYTTNITTIVGATTVVTAYILQSNLDGTGQVTIHSLQGATFTDLKLDVANDNIYWSTNSGISTAKLSNLPKTITSFSVQGEAYGIDIDIAAGKIYWAGIDSKGVPQLGRANFNGTLIENLQTSPTLSNPKFIAIEFAAPCKNPPTANAGLDQIICEGNLVNLAAIIGGSATSITWTSSGDGVFNDNTILTASYTPGTNDITNGTVTLTILTNDPDGTGLCVSASDFMIVNIEKAHTISTSADQVICPTDIATIIGTIGGSATSAIWTTSGDGTFDTPNSLTANYTSGINDITSGLATITLSTTSTACPSVSSQIIITVIQPIVSINQIGTLKVGETITINALNGATLPNTGDLITTTVVANPQKGTITINTDSTIDYTALQDNVGSDSFDFQICNQCNLCSIATANIIIENDAPSFLGTNSTAVPGFPISINITSRISDINANIDFSSLKIIQQPNSGATATIDANNNLIVDYTGIVFFGTDQVIIEVCDFDGACANATILIEVVAKPVVAFNAVSPNGDGRHDFLEFEYIEGYPDNEIKIFNRWGDEVFTMQGYNNLDKVFTGKSNIGGNKDLPTGTYYYTVYLVGTNETINGFLN